MYRITKLTDGSLIADTTEPNYIYFNPHNYSPIGGATKKNALGVSTGSVVYLIYDPGNKEMTKKQNDLPTKRQYEYCVIEEISADQNILEMQKTVDRLKKGLETQEKNTLILMGAIADLYEKVKG